MFMLAIGLMARASVGPAERLLNMLGEQRACAMVYVAAFVDQRRGSLHPRADLWCGSARAIATARALVIKSALLFMVTRRRLGLHVFVWRTPGRLDSSRTIATAS